MSESVMVESSPEFVSPAVPDRADQPVSETTERFLRAILTKVPLERIEELHLFTPLRQGTVETGIAVVAARAVVPEPTVEATEESPELELEQPVAPGDEFEEQSTEPTEQEEQQESPDEEIQEDPDEQADGTPDVPEVEDNFQPIERHTVYTARYRLVIKGPERGKWESDVVEEADAPLVTVETVVRGVQRRAGEDSEIVRYNGRQIARALRVDYPDNAS